MARIPETEIGRLKEQVSLVSLAEAAGVTLRGTGADLTGCCPFLARRCEAEGLDRDLVRFTRRQLREALPFGDTQLKVHLARLADYELVIPHRTASGGFRYELAWQPGTDCAVVGSDATAIANRSAPKGPATTEATETPGNSGVISADFHTVNRASG